VILPPFSFWLFYRQTFSAMLFHNEQPVPFLDNQYQVLHQAFFLTFLDAKNSLFGK